MIQDSINKIWPDWQIIRELGHGANGTVYEAVHSEQAYGVKSSAAIKVISIPKDDAEVEAFRGEGHSENAARSYFYSTVTECVREIKCLMAFRGMQNTVSLEDYKVVEKPDRIGWTIYIRMELLTPLTEHWRGKTVTEQDVIKLGCDICSALERCSQKNVIHRDIKPENIFVNSFGDYKLGDFGIARRLERTSSAMTKTGTPLYMAPEVEQGEKYDARVDLYSLGLVLYQFANRNQLPFMEAFKRSMNPNDRAKALRRRLDGERLPAPCDASQALSEIILCACSHDPNDRFNTAAAMKHALMNLSNGCYEYNRDVLSQTQTVRPPRAPAGGGPKPPRNLVSIGKAVGVVLIVLAVLFALGAVARNASNWLHRGSETGGSGEESGPAQTVTEAVYSDYDLEQIAIIIDEADALAANGNFAQALTKIKTASAIYTESEELREKEASLTQLIEDSQSQAEPEAYQTETEASDEPDAQRLVEEQLAQMPELVGYASETAISMLQEIDYPVEKRYSYSDSVNIGCVMSVDVTEDSIVLEISRGPEHTHCSMYKLNAKGAVDYIRVYHRDENGITDYCDRYDGDGNYTYYVEYVTNGDGVVTKLYTYNPDGSIHHTWIYDHDVYGRIVGENYHDENDAITDRDEYVYGTDGKVKEYLQYDQNGLFRRWIMREYDSTVSLMSCSPHVIGNWTYADIYDKNGKLIRHATQSFDEYGVAERMTVYYQDGSLGYQYVFQSAWVSESNEHANDVLRELGFD